jgi:hypothetical protein
MGQPGLVWRSTHVWTHYNNNHRHPGKTLLLTGGKQMFFWFMFKPVLAFSIAAAAWEWFGGKILDKWGK